MFYLYYVQYEQHFAATQFCRERERMNQVERMNRYRKNLLKGILWGFGIWAIMQLIWTSIAFNHLIPQTSRIFSIISMFVPTAVLASILIVLLFLLKYWRYRWILRKDPQIRLALDDERLRLNWFMSYRVGFFAVIFMHIILFLNWAIPGFVFHKHGFSLPQETQTQLALLVGVLACVGAFLHFGREE